MALETATYTSDLVSTNPTSSDAKSQGDDHIRLLKATIKATFPNVSGAMTATHTQLNTVPNLAPIASPTFTGVPAAPTATLGTSTTQLATTAFVQAAALAASGVPSQSGNNGKFLTTDGSSASWANTGLTLVASLTPTAAANLDFLTAFSSAYDNYLIIGQGVTPATTDGFSVRVAVAGAADTASNYYRLSGVTNTTAAAVAKVDLTGGILAGGTGLDFSIHVKNVNSTTKLKSLVFEGVGHQDATPTYAETYVSGAYPAASVVTGLRLFWSAGNNFAAVGTIYVYGYSKT
jgi:hypothetical protein